MITLPDGWTDQLDCKTMILVMVGIHHLRKHGGAEMEKKMNIFLREIATYLSIVAKIVW